MKQMLTLVAVGTALALVACDSGDGGDVMNSRAARECRQLLSIRDRWSTTNEAIIAEWREMERREYESEIEKQARIAAEKAVQEWNKSYDHTKYNSREAVVEARSAVYRAAKEKAAKEARAKDPLARYYGASDEHILKQTEEHRARAVAQCVLDRK